MSPDDGFLLPGHECACDADSRCGNHDEAAEQEYWYRQWKGHERELAVDDIALAYDRHDPKRYALMEDAA